MENWDPFRILHNSLNSFNVIIGMWFFCNFYKFFFLFYSLVLLKVLLYKTCKIHCPWENGFVVLLGSINASITLVNTHKFLKQIKFSDTAYFKVGMLNKIASALIVNTRTPATWDYKTYGNGTARPSVCLLV